MVIPYIRIVPWKNVKELDDLKKWFYPEKFNSTDDSSRLRAIAKVKSYHIKGSQYLPHVIDSTAQLTNIILQDQSNLQDTLSIRLSYTMVLIRFVNGLLDPTQQSQFAIPLHTLAKNIGLASWFVDLRHSGTHERDLPSLDMLRLASKDVLNWLWDHYWNDDQLQDDEDVDLQIDHERLLKIEKLDKVLQSWLNEKFLLLENSWIWENNKKTNIISSTNFEIQKNTTGSKRKHDEIELSPYEVITNLIEQIEKIWKFCQDKNLFIERCIYNYDPLIFQIFMMKLNNFDFEFISWLLNCFKNIHLLNTSDSDEILQMENQVLIDQIKLLKKKFPNWQILKSKLLKKQLSKINIKLLQMEWENWNQLLIKNSSYLSIWISAKLIKLIEIESLNNSKKKKKQKQNLKLTDQELQIELQNYVKNYSNVYNDGEFRMYDLISIDPQLKPLSTNKEASNNKELPKDKNITNILDDLANLKKRMLNRHTKENSQVIWELHKNWTPKPFGTL
ncbi:hypothetical protein TBLA_0C02050 [Henningerozyma blattae CBS 6284]|uniref:Las1p n=1 Tax=Henningerozyma blattae (strain ATCC 34711 / CBS 6284 / DSM 70876 / NBRC 10599 / NRRL Y-10934 / UCD 77-7) TaxID=1071380 RepID=I2H0W5_HENB6|nr:hypothetical protein TBLA_0C02050 [Tetrapisispora blattae CBS 6284]CCH60017.1 hypothetical protein TBLA_0C02050 [Tetrapisispora blattae CBS 6284]